MYSILESAGVRTPGSVSVHEGDNIIMLEDGSIEITKQYPDGSFDIHTFKRPFVEKPLDADDHSVRIHDLTGYTELFRKVGNKSNDRHEGEIIQPRGVGYMYEPFIDRGANAKDLKVYVVGDIVQGETRKAPTLDGVVLRDPQTGKELRDNE